jgi:hypothetical protein
VTDDDKKVVRVQIEHYQSALRLWNEPNGFLLPSEPDPRAREIIRAELKGAIHALRWVLGETTP